MPAAQTGLASPLTSACSRCSSLLTTGVCPIEARGNRCLLWIAPNFGKSPRPGLRRHSGTAQEPKRNFDVSDRFGCSRGSLKEGKLAYGADRHDAVTYLHQRWGTCATRLTLQYLIGLGGACDQLPTRIGDFSKSRVVHGSGTSHPNPMDRVYVSASTT